MNKEEHNRQEIDYLITKLSQQDIKSQADKREHLLVRKTPPKSMTEPKAKAPEPTRRQTTTPEPNKGSTFIRLLMLFVVPLLCFYMIPKIGWLIGMSVVGITSLYIHHADGIDIKTRIFGPDYAQKASPQNKVSKTNTNFKKKLGAIIGLLAINTLLAMLISQIPYIGNWVAGFLVICTVVACGVSLFASDEILAQTKKSQNNVHTSNGPSASLPAPSSSYRSMRTDFVERSVHKKMAEESDVKWWHIALGLVVLGIFAGRDGAEAVQFGLLIFLLRWPFKWLGGDAYFLKEKEEKARKEVAEAEEKRYGRLLNRNKIEPLSRKPSLFDVSKVGWPEKQPPVIEKRFFSLKSDQERVRKYASYLNNCISKANEFLDQTISQFETQRFLVIEHQEIMHFTAHRINSYLSNIDGIPPINTEKLDHIVKKIDMPEQPFPSLKVYSALEPLPDIKVVGNVLGRQAYQLQNHLWPIASRNPMAAAGVAAIIAASYLFASFSGLSKAIRQLEDARGETRSFCQRVTHDLEKLNASNGKYIGINDALFAAHAEMKKHETALRDIAEQAPNFSTLTETEQAVVTRMFTLSYATISTRNRAV